MGKSYKKNIKDKNIGKKISIKKEIRQFDEKLVFETEEEFSLALNVFLQDIEEPKIRKYIFAYIRHILEKREKLTKQFDRKKKTASISKIEELKTNIEKQTKILSYLNKRLEEQKEEKHQKINKSSTKIESKIKKQEHLQDIDDYERDYISLGQALVNKSLDATYIEDIKDFIDLICHLEEEKQISKKAVENILYLIVDILRQKINKTNKDDKKTREEYKRIRSKTEIVLQIYKKEHRKPKHDYYYDILERLLTSPKNYYIIEKLLENIKEFVNAKTIIHQREITYEKHILHTIIDLYIRSYKLELRGQTKDFIPKEYYKKLYYLFLQNAYLEIDEKSIYKMLKDFLASIDNVNYLKNNKDQIIKEVESMLKGSEKIETIPIREKEKNYLKYIEYQMKDIENAPREKTDKKYLEEMLYYYEKIKGEFINPTKQELKQIQRTLNISNRTKRNITLGCETISFNDNHSYTISYYEDGAYSFKLNELDLHAVIKDTPLDKSENIVSQEEKLKIKEGKSIPSITYEVRIEPNGKIGPLKIYLSTSEVEKAYDKIGDNPDEKLKKFLSLYKLLTDDHKPNLDKEIVDTYFLSLFKNKIIEYVEERNIPLIVKGISDFDQDYYMQLHYELCEIYSKLPKKHFEQIFEILSTNLEKEHFVNHDYQKGNYHIHLENDYVKYLNQQMLKSCIIKKEEETFIPESNEVMERANRGICYIGILKPIDKSKKNGYYKK